MKNFRNSPFSFSVKALIALIEANKNKNIGSFEGERIIKRIYNAGGPVRANEIFWYEIVCQEIQRIYDLEIADGLQMDYYKFEKENFNYCAENAEAIIKTYWLPLV